MQTNEPPISDVEDLDPEPAPRESRPDRRELVLGGMLLLIVLGWAGWQWWQQASKERNYNLGRQAEKEYRWSEALAGYSAASGYLDATARAASVTGLINSLQDNLVSARWYADGGNWPAVLRAVQTVRGIDPQYSDASSLGAEAEQHVYSDALQGAVAMRPQAQPPGLYFRAADRWVWLQGSDRWSSVRSILSDGIVVYDVPRAGEDMPGGPTPTAVPSPSTSPDSRQGTGWLEGRRLVAASLAGDEPRFGPLAFDPALYDFYIAGDRGVWGVRKEGDQPGRQSFGAHAALRDTFSFLIDRELDYQSLDGAASSSVLLPGPEWAILNADLKHDRLLLADIKAQRGESATIDLYIAGGAGTNRRLLYSHRGALGSTQFSPDGRYLLLTTYSPLGGTRTEKQSLVLLDLQGGALPASPAYLKLIGDKVVSAAPTCDSCPDNGPLTQVRATFLLKGPLAGMVLVAEWGSAQGTLRVLDPASPGSPLVSGEIPGGLAGKAWANEPEDGADVVVAWQPWLSGSSTRDASLVVARLAPGKPVATQTFTLDKESEVLGSVIRGDYLICTAYRAAAGQDSAEFTTYSLPLSGSGDEQARAEKLYSLTMPGGTNPFLSGFAWQFGSKLLSYSDKGQLHARTYDGAVDVPLEAGVQSFFNFEWVSPALLLR